MSEVRKMTGVINEKSYAALKALFDVCKAHDLSIYPHDGAFAETKGGLIIYINNLPYRAMSISKYKCNVTVDSTVFISEKD